MAGLKARTDDNAGASHGAGLRHDWKKNAMNLEILEPAECLRLLGSAEIGRIAYTDEALPAVVPVNFLLHNGAIVFRTGQGGKLAAAVRNAVVAFEVDDVDSGTRTGWSVTAIGYARVVYDAGEWKALARLGLCTWAPGAHQSFVVIVPEILRGRRISGTGAISRALNEPKSGVGPAA
ncbi:pyridoxamine 5'-phosphate oxidase family protein [Allokutzneria albata]|uniref:Nitroimidazol reductase NimA, pyridoxamine 5'-phosphate oxidase superfamily n=1 Tax=Allokutzneria albata TaxID=211114 RepID=A0A1G9SIU1_ALLAB|nr:pyridoxamine 5'-phosphate oxidase family protein [Allokutzneria albata]SDM35331.1 Nitroimidazol reductase NimA, pyridoxamine 5'-phosphate oxidase superfamily [Allokutzneria albata]